MGSCQTLNNLFAKSFIENSHKTALIFYNREITYGELFFDAIRFTNFFLRHEVIEVWAKSVTPN